jgi:hypothetical protein
MSQVQPLSSRLSFSSFVSRGVVFPVSLSTISTAIEKLVSELHPK